MSRIDKKIKEFGEEFPNIKTPCSCPKGGIIVDVNGREYTCPECGGSEWVVPGGIKSFLRKTLEEQKAQLLKAVIDELPSVWHYTNKASNAEKVVARFHNDEINLLKEKLEQAL